MKTGLIVAAIVVATIIALAVIAAAHHRPRSYLDRYAQCVQNAPTYAAWQACAQQP
jgi:hypothetical protein